MRHLWDVDVTGQVHSWGSVTRAWSGSTGQVSACPLWPQAWAQFAPRSLCREALLRVRANPVGASWWLSVGAPPSGDVGQRLACWEGRRRHQWLEPARAAQTLRDGLAHRREVQTGGPGPGRLPGGRAAFEPSSASEVPAYPRTLCSEVCFKGVVGLLLYKGRGDAREPRALILRRGHPQAAQWPRGGCTSRGLLQRAAGAAWAAGSQQGTCLLCAETGPNQVGRPGCGARRPAVLWAPSSASEFCPHALPGSIWPPARFSLVWK